VGLENGSLYAMIAVGYTLVYGVLGLINFAHGEVFMCGGFAAVFLTHGILGDRVANGWESVFLILAGIAIAGSVSAWWLPVWNKLPTGRYGEETPPNSRT